MDKEKIGIVDYGLGNLRSVVRAFDYLGKEAKIISTKEDILETDRLILPGIGAFSDGINGLKERNLIQPIYNYVKSKRPLLGVCLGMQLLMSESEEFGLHKGLDLIKGRVISLKSVNEINEEGYKVPHIDWSELVQDNKRGDNTILSKIPNKAEVYFVHSFHVVPENKAYILAKTVYGKQDICGVIKKDNIMGCQFHPEMSGKVGLQIYKNFCELRVE